jgi:hypothetical protein
MQTEVSKNSMGRLGIAPPRLHLLHFALVVSPSQGPIKESTLATVTPPFVSSQGIPLNSILKRRFGGLALYQDHAGYTAAGTSVYHRPIPLLAAVIRTTRRSIGIFCPMPS